MHDVPCINGILMLTPRNTVVKGYQVEELDSVREWSYENRFRTRLGSVILLPFCSMGTRL